MSPKQNGDSMLQNTSNIAYQPLPLGCDNELEEIVIESIDKNEMTVIQLFKEMQDNLRNSVTETDVSLACQFSFMCTMLTFTPGIVLGIVFNPLWLLSSIPGAIGSLYSLKNTYAVANIKNNADCLLLRCNDLKAFHDYFEEFKLDPQDLKLRRLFEFFNEITKSGELSDLIYEEDSKLFHDTGKLFLMDAACKLLQEKNKNSLVANQWKENLESALNTDSCSIFAEPWHSIGIENPKLESYLDFAIQRKNLHSIMIADRIVHIYKNMMETFLANNKEIPFCSPIHLKSTQ